MVHALGVVTAGQHLLVRSVIMGEISSWEDKIQIISIMQGSIKIKVLRADILKDEQFFGKMDPYVRVVYKENTMHTQVAKDMGKHPKWEETFSIRFNSRVENELSYEVLNSYSDDMSKDHLLGRGTTLIDTLASFSGQDIQLPFLHNGVTAGQVVLNLTFLLDNISQERKGRQKELDQLNDQFLAMQMSRKSVGVKAIHEQVDLLSAQLQEVEQQLSLTSSQVDSLSATVQQEEAAVQEIREQKLAQNKEVGQILQQIEEESEAFKREREEGVSAELVLEKVRLALGGGGEEGCLVVGRTGGRSAMTQALGGGEKQWEGSLSLGGDGLRTLHFEVFNSSYLSGEYLVGQGALAVGSLRKGEETSVRLSKEAEGVGHLLFTPQ